VATLNKPHPGNTGRWGTQTKDEASYTQDMHGMRIQAQVKAHTNQTPKTSLQSHTPRHPRVPAMRLRYEETPL